MLAGYARFPIGTDSGAGACKRGADGLHLGSPTAVHVGTPGFHAQRRQRATRTIHGLLHSLLHVQAYFPSAVLMKPFCCASHERAAAAPAGTFDRMLD
jgi:hypothetical protein